MDHVEWRESGEWAMLFQLNSVGARTQDRAYTGYRFTRNLETLHLRSSPSVI